MPRHTLGARRFEKVLAEGAAVPVGSAADDLSVFEALKQALQRLEQQPRLRCHGPGGVVTYDDPVLAVAHAWGSAAAGVAGAAAKGEELRNSLIHRWALAGVRALLHRGDHEFIDLASRIPTQSLYINKDIARVAVVGDAGYCGTPQGNVLFLIKKVHEKHPFDLIIHLGDTYFAGSEAEFVRHLLAPFSEFGVRFITLCGNHDLYHGPLGFAAALRVLRQQGRFLMIETPHWRVAGLDTTLGSARVLRNDGSLDQVQLEWLEKHLLSNDARRLVLMSHHFIVSGWEAPAETLLLQLKGRVRDRVFAWYWGHEHRCATYDPGDEGFYGACVGNGAFLEKWSVPEAGRTPPTWYTKERCSCFGSRQTKYWPHGFLELEFGLQSIKESYHLEGGQTHVRELSIRSN